MKIASRNQLGMFAALFAIASLTSGCGIFNQPIESPAPSLHDQMPFSGARPNTMIRLQSPDDDPSPNSGIGNQKALRSVADQANIVKDVVLRGNRTVATHQLMRNIRTRPGRYFDPDMLQQDVNDLWKMKEVHRVVGPFIDRSADGIVVTIEVVERQLMQSVQFIGNRAITDRALRKETNLTDGQPLDVHEIKMVKHRIEEFYHNKGFPRTQVEILEGNEDGDSSVVFLIHEDEQQRIWKVEFEGNRIASNARLKSFIESKPGVLKVIGGLVKRKEIEQDVLRLTSYYRSLGFFNARVGRQITESANGRWLNLRFIIDEGPRYQIRNVSFMGNQAFTDQQLATMLELKPAGEGAPEFNAAKMNQDVVSLRDLYGANGFVFAKVEVETRFLEEPGQLDLVYKIEEDKQYRVGDIKVFIEGSSGTTRREVVMNRLSLRPGDVIDLREIRNSERRLGTSQVFSVGEPGSGTQPPKIVVKPSDRSPARMANGPQSNHGSTRR